MVDQGGYRPKLLLIENVIPDTGANMHMASLDLLMSVLHASGERSEKTWRALLEQAGYHITGVFTSDAIDEGVIEAEAVSVSWVTE